MKRLDIAFLVASKLLQQNVTIKSEIDSDNDLILTINDKVKLAFVLDSDLDAGVAICFLNYYEDDNLFFEHNDPNLIIDVLKRL